MIDVSLLHDDMIFVSYTASTVLCIKQSCSSIGNVLISNILSDSVLFNCSKCMVEILTLNIPPIIKKYNNIVFN